MNSSTASTPRRSSRTNEFGDREPDAETIDVTTHRDSFYTGLLDKDGKKLYRKVGY